MNNCEQIHETVIRDIVDVITDVRKSEGLKSVFAKGNFKSISNASSNLTIIFPNLASSGNKIENSAMVSKAVERKAVTMLQMLFSAINITNGDGEEYIRKFHTNLKFDSSFGVDEFIDIVDRHVVEHENAGYQIADRELYNMVKEDLKNLNYFLPDILSETSINDYRVMPSIYNHTVTLNEKSRRIDDLAKAYAAGKDSAQLLKYKSELVKLQTLDSDVKKANELMPTMMIVNFISMQDGVPIPQQIVIGVKSKMYLMESQDIINRIVSKNRDGNGLNAFIRASTREISFWKDFVFAIEKAKLDALSSGSMRGSSSKTWKLLERRALKSRVKRYMGITPNDATAITSLTISKDEVEYLKKTENINIEQVQTARQIMDAYNLMTLIIVDEAMETVKFLYDDDSGAFETLTFNHLERETSDGGYKKVINLMTKMSR